MAHLSIDGWPVLYKGRRFTALFNVGDKVLIAPENNDGNALLVSASNLSEPKATPAHH